MIAIASLLPSESDINARCSAIQRLRARYEAADAEDIVHETFLKFFHVLLRKIRTGVSL